MLSRQQKEEQVSALREKLSAANTLVAIDYRGLTVGAANDLRGRLRGAESEIDYRVAKNTIIRRAVEGTDAAGLVEHLTGPTALAIGYDEPSVVARALFDYAKENESFEIKGGVVEGEVVDSEVLERLAKLPTKQELRGMLAGTLQAPLRNLAGTLNALLGHLRNALEQRQSQLEA
jgi:large subunit ribosomal protein L10